MTSAPSRLLGGAASGALALVVLAVAEILTRPASLPPLTAPLQDTAALAVGGALAGLVVAVKAFLPGLRWLSPFWTVLGGAVGLAIWIPGISGANLVGGRAVSVALAGGLWMLGGALAGQLAAFTTRRLFRRATRNAGLPSWAAALVLLAVLTPLVWSLVPPLPRPPASAPNLLLLTIDTLRSDRLGLAGHPAPTSPHLDRLARRGVTSVRATTPLPRTLPAMVSLFTGAHAQVHGVRDNFHYALAPEAWTLAGFLAEQGWATAAVNSNPVLSHASGVYRGFQSASDRGDDWSRLTIARGVRRLVTLARMRRTDRSRVITDLALGWLRRRPADRPYFLWVHWLSPHMPYEPAAPFDRLFDPDYEGPYARAIDYGEISKGDMTYRNPLPPRVLEHVKHLYDGEIATADAALGALLDEMELRGELENTLVLFTSDHGESLDEHGYFLNHGDLVYGPATNVPFVVREPGAPGVPRGGVLDRKPISLVTCAADMVTRLAGRGTDDPPASTAMLDVAPGLAPGTAAGPPGDEPGADAAMFGESGFCRFPHLNPKLGYLLPREIAQSPDRIPDWKERWEAQANRAKQRFVQVGDRKLVLTPHPDGDRVELFDLAADPAETENVLPAHAGEAAVLEARLRAWIAEGEAQPTAATARVIDERMRETLESLGYLGQ